MIISVGWQVSFQLSGEKVYDGNFCCKCWTWSLFSWFWIHKSNILVFWLKVLSPDHNHVQVNDVILNLEQLNEKKIRPLFTCADRNNIELHASFCFMCNGWRIRSQISILTIITTIEFIPILHLIVKLLTL